MKKLILCIAILFSLPTIAQNTDLEKEAIKKVIQTAYVDGLQNEGDLEKIDSGIHPDFVLLGIGKEKSMWKYPIEKWKANTTKKLEEGKLPRTGDDLVTIKFLDVDVTGNAAVAKIEFYVGDQKKYVDYISLYRFENDWMMVNKIYYEFKE